MDTTEILEKIFISALSSVNPSLLIKRYIDEMLSDYVKGQFRQFFVVGFGKASYQMAKALEESIDNNLITSGIVITKYGHAGIQTTDDRLKTKDVTSIKIYEAGHPVPDENGIKATEEVMKLLKRADKDSLILCLVSGGGSALLVSPWSRISLNDKQKVTELLLKAGADITELNAVRKHISRIKGGRFAEIAYPAEIITLIISDVIGDRLDVIASGPTAPDTSTYEDALSVLSKYRLLEKTPRSVIEMLRKGRKGFFPETPKQNNPVFKHVQNIVIGSNLKALNAAKDTARSLGFKVEILSSEITGEARDAGKWLAQKAVETFNTYSVTHDEQKICLISGGETTVTVRGSGKGGRNTELALAFAREINGMKGITFLSAGTDGTDGPTDAAGAIVDGQTISKAENLGLNPEFYLDNNDSYSLFKHIDSLLITGPTGTNVMDLQIILIEINGSDR